MATWTDFRGRVWLVTTSAAKLKFNIPCHAALRAHVFHRDRFTCVRCGAKAVDIPSNYDGRYSLKTDSRDSFGWYDVLIVDHIVTRKAGGRNVVENLQTLCETCNRKKIREDVAAISAYRAGLPQ